MRCRDEAPVKVGSGNFASPRKSGPVALVESKKRPAHFDWFGGSSGVVRNAST